MIDMMMCVFCGEERAYVHKVWNDKSTYSTHPPDYCYVFCDNCLSRGPRKANEGEAVAGWERQLELKTALQELIGFADMFAVCEVGACYDCDVLSGMVKRGRAALEKGESDE